MNISEEDYLKAIEVHEKVKALEPLLERITADGRESAKVLLSKFEASDKVKVLASRFYTLITLAFQTENSTLLMAGESSEDIWCASELAAAIYLQVSQSPSKADRDELSRVLDETYALIRKVIHGDPSV